MVTLPPSSALVPMSPVLLLTAFVREPALGWLGLAG